MIFSLQVSQYLCAMRADNTLCKLKYEDLTNNFEPILISY